MANAPAEGKPDALFVSRETGESRQLTHPVAPLLGDSNPAISYQRPMAGLSSSGRCQRGRTPRASPERRLRQAENPLVSQPPTRRRVSCVAAKHRRNPVLGPRKFVAAGYSGGRATDPDSVYRQGPGRSPTITGGSARTPAIRLRPISSDGNIWRIDTPGPGEPGRLSEAVTIASTRMDLLGDLSPDGTRIAFVSNRSGAFEIWQAQANGSNPIPLTAMGGPMMTATPRWSPDGKLIAFQSSVEGQSEIYTIPSDGGKVAIVSLRIRPTSMSPASPMMVVRFTSAPRGPATMRSGRCR